MIVEVVDENRLLKKDMKLLMMSITFTSMGSQSMLDTISPTIPPNKRAWSSEVFAKTLVSGYREQ